MILVNDEAKYILFHLAYQNELEKKICDIGPKTSNYLQNESDSECLGNSMFVGMEYE